MTVRPHAKQDQVEARELFIGQAENFGQRSVVLSGSSSGIPVLSMNAMNILCRNGNPRDHRFIRHAVVAVSVIRRNMALVAPEEVDLSPGDLRSNVFLRALRQQRIKHLWGAASRERNHECSLTLDRFTGEFYEFVSSRLGYCICVGEDADF